MENKQIRKKLERNFKKYLLPNFANQNAKRNVYLEDFSDYKNCIQYKIVAHYGETTERHRPDK